MKRILVSGVWAIALSLGLGGLVGCSSSSGSGSSTSTPQTPYIFSFTASPATITAGTSANLTALFNNGTGVITPGNLAVTSGTAISVSPTATTTYTLTVSPTSGAAITQTATVTVVAAPAITSFAATPTSIPAGASASLTGVFANGTGIVTPGNLTATSGTAVTVTPTATTTYTLTVTNAASTAVAQTATVTVTAAVPAPTITSFVANPAAIAAGGSSNLTAIFSNGTGAVMPGNLPISSGTPLSVSPTATSTYALTVTNSAGATVAKSTTVALQPTGGTLLANGTYTLANQNSGLYVDVTGASTTAGALIDQWQSNGQGNQQWQLTNLGNNTVKLISVSSGLALEAQGSSTTPGGAIDQAAYNATPNQIWQVVAVGAGYYEFYNQNSGLALDVPSASTTDGTKLDQATATGNTNQMWYLFNMPSPNADGTTNASVTVDPTTPGLAVTDQILGMNMAYWYDQSNPAIVPAFQTAGIKAIRWPGGSGSDVYHWQTNTLCGGGTGFPAAYYPTFLADVVKPSGVDVALTANYGTNETCNGPGDPAEAAAWATYSLQNGNYVSHMTVGNEVYGTWETDLHAKPNDAATYANAVATGYYPQIKAANPNLQVGVVVEPGNNPAWDPIVLAQAPYDFVEYHFYAQSPNYESDPYLTQQAALAFAAAINSVKADLNASGHPNTPIYAGELGSVYGNPGIQSSSITQALYAGQVLGEAMNAGVARATWWIGFGGCAEAGDGDNFSSSLYGWEGFGGYMVFSDGLPEGGCDTAPSIPAGTLLPTARAYQLFSNVAVNGEHVLNASVTGDTLDVRAYAATNNGGTALVLFNLNETTSAPVVVTLTGQTTASSVTVETYDKAIYDQAQNNVWAGPTTTSLGAQTLPMTLTLAPWSMNVVIIKP